MQGPDFWQIFLSAGVPENELLALGEDIGYTKDTPSSLGAAALLKLAYMMGKSGAKVSSNALFDALKAEMPGLLSRKSLLTGLADDYSKNKPYSAIAFATREYIDQVGKHLPNATKIDNEVEVHTSTPTTPTTPTAPAQPAPAPATATATPAAAPVPKGLTETQWNFLKAVVAKIGAGQGDKITANNLASARNLAERANLQIVQVLDAEIIARGDGAQNPDDQQSPAKAAVATVSSGVGAIGILGLFVVAFLLSRA